MDVEVQVNFGDHIPESAEDGLAMVGLLQALCEVAHRLGLSRSEFISRIPAAVAETWTEKESDG